MAFLDNSGDIILDAVLTDEGRRRLAKGDGSFKIVKFALGDDEIDYSLYNGDHPSGSAYYDLDLLQTPVLEAFTNNIASMHNKLISLPRTDLLFMPIIKINTLVKPLSQLDIMYYGYMVPVNKTSLSKTTTNLNTLDGLLIVENGQFIQLDQGLDTTKLSYSQPAPADLIETEYMITIDNKLGYITDTAGNQQNYVSIDDDGYATYSFSKDIDTSFVTTNTNTQNAAGAGSPYQIISGPRGTILKFGIKPSINLVDDYLFGLLGTTASDAGALYSSTTTKEIQIIKTSVEVEGVSTGYRIEIPVYFFRNNS